MSLFGNQKPPTGDANIPIVGQAYQIRDWYPTVLLVCNCQPENKAMMILARGPGQCPLCKQIYTLQGISILPNGAVQFAMAIGTPAPAPSGETVN